jgi:RNA polymerase sigma-70 factor (ECF subfamily)
MTEQEFSERLTTLKPFLHNIAFKIVNDYHKSDEIVFQAAQKAWRHYNPERGGFESLIKNITRNLAIDAVRANARRRKLITDAIEANVGDTIYIDRGYVENPISEIVQLFTRLNKTDMKIIEMIGLHGMSIADTARHLNQKIETIKSRLYRARKKIKSIAQIESYL